MFLVTLYRHIKDKHGQKTSFIILLAFLVSFIIARFYALLSITENVPYLTIRHIHVHHLNIGIAFLALSGFLAFYLANSRFHKKVAILYGIGLGLTFDEFAMWLHLEDHYWMRASYDAIIIISIILINVAFFGNFWLKIWRKIYFHANPHYAGWKNFSARLKRNMISVIMELYSKKAKSLFYAFLIVVLGLILIKIKSSFFLAGLPRLR